MRLRCIALALALGALGCSGGIVTQAPGCQSDDDCPVDRSRPFAAGDWVCDRPSGTCQCARDSACRANQFCNARGFCQNRSLCVANVDCPAGNICDTNSGICVAGQCSSDLQCGLGQVCDTTRRLCINGCRSNGDCNAVSCRCGATACACTGTTQAERERCAVGVCDPGFCADNSFCRYGETCQAPPPPDAGPRPDGGADGGVDGGSRDGGVRDGGVRDAGPGPVAQCTNDYDPVRRPYCDNCLQGGSVSTCGRGPNFCLIDTRNPGNNYCGADCSEGQSCPRGYSCNDVIVILTQQQCTRANPACQVNQNLPCREDTDCPRGGVCGKLPGALSGFCAGRCSIGEGQATGYCTCLVDNDCATETCRGGECDISRKPCTQASDCRAIRCVDFRGFGGCLIGQNCAPGQGLSCLDVKPPAR